MSEDSEPLICYTICTPVLIGKPVLHGNNGVMHGDVAFPSVIVALIATIVKTYSYAWVAFYTV